MRIIQELRNELEIHPEKEAFLSDRLPRTSSVANRLQKWQNVYFGLIYVRFVSEHLQMCQIIYREPLRWQTVYKSGELFILGLFMPDSCQNVYKSVRSFTFDHFSSKPFTKVSVHLFSIFLGHIHVRTFTNVSDQGVHDLLLMRGNRRQFFQVW